MKLADYLKLKGLKQVEFSKLSGVSEPVLTRLVNESAPRVGWKTIRAIHEATGGEVTASDILNFDRMRDDDNPGSAAGAAAE